MFKLKLICHAMIALLPSFLKKPIYRLICGYSIGKRAKIGFSILFVDNLEIGDDVSIGHFNIFFRSSKLAVGSNTKIGHFNLIRGGEVEIGRYVEIIRFNELNSIPDPIVSNETDPRLSIGDGSIITTSHKIDFTDRVKIGKRTIIGGRNSSLWTHNRQETRPIIVGDFCYVGSEVRIAPGGEIPSSNVIGIGSVITNKLSGEYQLFGGVPARLIKPLDDEGKRLTRFKTRPDLPDEIE